MKRSSAPSWITFGAFALAFALALATSADASEDSRRFALFLQLDTNTSPHSWSDANHTAGTDLWIWPQYRLGRHLNLSALTVIGRSWTGEKETAIRATDFVLRRNAIPLSRVFRFSPALIVTPPFATDRLTRESLILAAKIAPRFNYDLAPLGLHRITGFLEVSGGRQFHRFTTSTTGRINNQYSVNLWATLSYSISERLNFGLSGMRTSAWNYAGDITNSFKLSEDVSFRLSDRVSVMLSHENGGALLGPNGRESNFALVDPQASTLTTSIAISL